VKQSKMYLPKGLLPLPVDILHVCLESHSEEETLSGIQYIRERIRLNETDKSCLDMPLLLCITNRWSTCVNALRDMGAKAHKEAMMTYETPKGKRDVEAYLDYGCMFWTDDTKTSPWIMQIAIQHGQTRASAFCLIALLFKRRPYGWIQSDIVRLIGKMIWEQRLRTL